MTNDPRFYFTNEWDPTATYFYRVATCARCGVEFGTRSDDGPVPLRCRDCDLLRDRERKAAKRRGVEYVEELPYEDTTLANPSLWLRTDQFAPGELTGDVELDAHLYGVDPKNLGRYHERRRRNLNGLEQSIPRWVDPATVEVGRHFPEQPIGDLPVIGSDDPVDAPRSPAGDSREDAEQVRRERAERNAAIMAVIDQLDEAEDMLDDAERDARDYIGWREPRNAIVIREDDAAVLVPRRHRAEVQRLLIASTFHVDLAGHRHHGIPGTPDAALIRLQRAVSGVVPGVFPWSVRESL